MDFGGLIALVTHFGLETVLRIDTIVFVVVMLLFAGPVSDCVSNLSTMWIPLTSFNVF